MALKLRKMCHGIKLFAFTQVDGFTLAFCDAKSLPLEEHGRPMVLLLQSGDQLVPEQTPAVVLHRCGGPVRHVLPWSSALCTMTPAAQGGQEGLGKGNQVQVCHGSPSGAVLVLGQPQPRLPVFENECHSPAPFVRRDQPSHRPRQVRSHQPKDLPGSTYARADPRQGPKGTDLEPARSGRAVTDTAVRCRPDK
jgi:hypothetical protein